MHISFGPQASYHVLNVLEYVSHVLGTVCVLREYNQETGELSVVPSTGTYLVDHVTVRVDHGETFGLAHSLADKVSGHFAAPNASDISGLFKKAQQWIMNKTSGTPGGTHVDILSWTHKWRVDGTTKKRGFQTLHLPSSVMGPFRADLGAFFSGAKKEWYTELGLPHTRTYMLHGPPGTGKTSLIQCVASEYDMNVAVFTVGPRTNDEDFRDALKSLPPRTLLCIEDVDCMFVQRDVEKSLLTFSGVINALDGVARLKEDMLIFVTTNHLDKLDPAFRRRVDYTIKFDYCTREQVRAIFKRFAPDTEGFEETCAGLKLTPSALQKFLLKGLPIEELGREIGDTSPLGMYV